MPELKWLVLLALLAAVSGVIAVSVFATHSDTIETAMVHSEISASKHLELMVTAMNYWLPCAVGCLVFLIWTHSSNPVGTGWLIISAIACLVGGSMGLEACEKVFTHVNNHAWDQLIWWYA